MKKAITLILFFLNFIAFALGGVKKIKSAVEQYNALPASPVSFFQKPELKLTANGNGLGVVFMF